MHIMAIRIKFPIDCFCFSKIRIVLTIYTFKKNGYPENHREDEQGCDY